MTTRSDHPLPGKIVWPGRKTRFDIDFFDLLQPLREVSRNSRFRSGTFRSEKCGRDIQYESALERAFAEGLERNEHVVFYWDQPVRIPFRRGKRRLGYTPDYGIYLYTGHFVLAEVKELPDMLDGRVQARIEAMLEFCSRRGFGVLLTDGRHAPDYLLRGKVNRKLEAELQRALCRDTLRHDGCREILETCRATPAQLYKAVIRLQLRFRPFPFRLQRGNDNRIFRQVFFERKRYRDALPAEPLSPFAAH